MTPWKCPHCGRTDPEHRAGPDGAYGPDRRVIPPGLWVPCAEGLKAAAEVKPYIERRRVKREEPMTRRMVRLEVVDGAAFFDAERLRWPEEKLQNEILRMAVGTQRQPSPLGWRAYHTHDSRHSAAGFPDLVLVRERIVYAELKTTKGKLSPSQAAWMEALRAAGGEVYLWRPCCWNSGEIEAVLR